MLVLLLVGVAVGVDVVGIDAVGVAIGIGVGFVVGAAIGFVVGVTGLRDPLCGKNLATIPIILLMCRALSACPAIPTGLPLYNTFGVEKT